jgi:signal transduction histidine kinase
VGAARFWQPGAADADGQEPYRRREYGADRQGTDAAVGVHNLYLTAELSRRVEEVRDQAAELAASRDRVVAGQNAERRRIQRVLHDGVQQEIVALSARAGLVRQQLVRGDPAAAGGLADLQRDLAATLQDIRELAYAIHPPVLSERGLLEAIEAQSSRLAVPMAVRADPRLRGVRFAEQIEVTAWYVLAEALSNVVKHAGASEVEVSLSQEDGRLGLVIRDDGCGFDLGRPRGLGLTGLSDRLDTVGGSLVINSGAGAGTSCCGRWRPTAATRASLRTCTCPSLRWKSTSTPSSPSSA